MAIIFLQARLGSTRLPKKITKILAGKTLIEQVVERLKHSLNDSIKKIVILTCFQSLNTIEKLFQNEPNLALFAGSENNVLERFYQASLNYPDDIIIRATGDNPFVSVPHIHSILKHHIDHKADLSHYLGLPLGSGVEIINRSALEKAYYNAQKDHQKEHVTPYIYENPTIFNVEEPQVIEQFHRPILRLTIDELADFQLAQVIFDHLGPINNFPLEKIILLLNNLSSES